MISFVIPRDAFNLANYMKCIGFLYLRTEHRYRNRVVIDFPDNPIPTIDPESGDMTCPKVMVWVDGTGFRPFVPCNSRNPNPLYLENSEGIEYQAIGRDNELHPEFLSLLEQENTL